MNSKNNIEPLLETLAINNKKYKHLSQLPSHHEVLKAHSQQGNYYQTETVKQQRYTFTAKDVFNSVVLPTSMGSAQWNGFKSGNNARIITDLKWAGDVLVAKTVTSEFAVHEETCVVNPWNESYSCGTSSAGAAVSTLIDPVDFALATQTGGSIGRPASYIGVLGYKPTFGLFPRTGVLKTCDSFDTVGLFAKNIDVIKNVLKTAAKVGLNFPKNRIDRKLNNHSKTVGVIRHKDIDYAKYVDDKLDDLILNLEKKGFKVKDVNVPDDFTNIHHNHSEIYSYSLGYYFSKELEDTTQVSDSLKEFIKISKDISVKEYTQGLQLHAMHLKISDEWLNSTDCSFFINPTTYGVAPKLGGIEPDDMNLFYTYLYMPTLYSPLWFNESAGLPFGCTIASAKGCDLSILDFAELLCSTFEMNEVRKYDQ